MATYTTTYGRELEVEPVSLLLLQRLQRVVREEFSEQGKELEPPQYCVDLPGGQDRQCYPHDEDTIEDPTTSEEDKKAWEQYQSNLDEFNAELTERMLGAILMDQPIEYDDGWEDKLKWLGIPIPDDELDRKHLYFTTSVLKTNDDLQGFMLKVMEISAGTAGEDAVQAARDMFRGQA